MIATFTNQVSGEPGAAHGKIARWQPFETHDAALKAAGLAV
jgi:hypothetical protein